MQKNEKITAALNNFIEANILLVLFCLPFSKSAVEVCVALSIAAFAVKKIFMDRSPGLSIDRRVLAGLLLFVLFNLLSIVNSQHQAHSLQAFFTKVLKWALFFIATADTIRTTAQARRIFVTMVFSCALILFDAIYQQYMTGRDFLHYPNPYPVFKFHARKEGGMSFPTASFPYPNDFASWINLYLFTFASMALFNLKDNVIYRSAAAILGAFLAFFLFLTTSSSALLGTFTSAAILLFMNLKKILVPFVIIMVVIALAVAFVPYLRVYLNLGTLHKTLSINDRIAMWSAGWRIFLQHPVVGNGVNTFFENFKNFREDEYRYKKGSYAHNCYLQMAADIGIFGVLSFLYFVLMSIFLVLRKTAKSASGFKGSLVFGLALGVVAFAVHGAFDTNFYSLNLAALFWLSMGAMEGLSS